MKDLKHLITWNDWNDNEINDLILFSKKVKKNRNIYQGYMAGRSMVMLFQKTSTRTRVSFEAALTELGGHAVFMDWKTTNFQLSKIRWETIYLSRNVSIIMARMMKHEDILEMKNASEVPVINGCDNFHHPCQSLADMLTILEDRGSLKKTKLTYIGVHNNVVNSMMGVCAAAEVELTLVCPIAEDSMIDHELKQKIYEKGLLKETLDVQAAVKNADYVYTDTWIDMEYFDNPEFKELKEERIKLMLPYQINAKLLKNSEAKILHDMPIHAGYEICEEVVESDRSLIFDQASNRLDAQKAVIITLLGDHLS